MSGRARRRTAPPEDPGAERPVVADVHPDSAGHRLALGEDRNRRVVAMQPFGGQDMRFDQRVQRTQRGGAGAHLIGERRQAKVEPFSGIALALPVERLVLSELLEQGHRQKAWAGEPARGDMERSRRLRDRLASPAGEPLPEGTIRNSVYGLNGCTCLCHRPGEAFAEQNGELGLG